MDSIVCQNQGSVGQMLICFVFGVQILVTLNKNAGEVTSRLDSENQPGGSRATLGDFRGTLTLGSDRVDFIVATLRENL